VRHRSRQKLHRTNLWHRQLHKCVESRFFLPDPALTYPESGWPHIGPELQQLLSCGEFIQKIHRENQSDTICCAFALQPYITIADNRGWALRASTDVL